MNKKELIETITKNHAGNGVSKKSVAAIIDDTSAAIAKGIKKAGRFSLPGFGTFTVKSRAARKGRNPQTGEPIKIKASKSVKFKAAPVLKKGL
ncbi:MAG: HU family DNA-binding protein [Candidatus Manganitrophaceae bacterium]